MTSEQIIEGNKLIAEFLGKDIGYSNMVIGGTHGWWTLMKYHSCWDWLMPVVEKIQNIDITPAPNYQGYSIKIVVQGYVKISGFPMHTILTNVSNEGGLINAVYKAVVDFIKWYNDEKNKM